MNKKLKKYANGDPVKLRPNNNWVIEPLPLDFIAPTSQQFKIDTDMGTAEQNQGFPRTNFTWPTYESPAYTAPSVQQYGSTGQDRLLNDPVSTPGPEFGNNLTPEDPQTLQYEEQKMFGYNPYAMPVSVFNMGLNYFSNMKNQSDARKMERKNNFLTQQPEPVYLNKRMAYGDKTMFAKYGGPVKYEEGGEYELTQQEIDRLIKLGYEFE